MKKFLVLAFVAVMMMSFAGGLQAAILDFSVISPTSGTISYAGGDNPLVGTDISVDLVAGIDTPLNTGVNVALSGALLNFTTGNLTASTSNTWTFGGGESSSIILTGGVDLDGGGIGAGDIPEGTTLFTGTFGSATVLLLSGEFRIAGSSFGDTKDADLAAYFGLGDVVDWSGNLNISFNASGSPPDGFTSSEILSGDITNTPVPEPGTMMLLGSGLVGLAGWGRKKFRK